MNFQIRLTGDDLLIDLEAFFKPIFSHLLTLEGKLMTALEDLNAKTDALTAEIAASSAKTESLITAFGEVGAQLAALQKQFQSSVPVTDADLAAVSAKIDAALAAVKSTEAKEDAVLAPPAAAPAPAPAAAADPVAAPTPAADPAAT